jgi:hypothetical protein
MRPERRAHLLGCERTRLATVPDIGRPGAVEGVPASGMGVGDIRRRRATPRPPCRHARRDRAGRGAEELSPLQCLAEGGASYARPRGGGTACLIIRHLCDHIPNRHHHRLHSSRELLRKTPSPPRRRRVPATLSENGLSSPTEIGRRQQFFSAQADTISVSVGEGTFFGPAGNTLAVANLPQHA